GGPPRRTRTTTDPPKDASSTVPWFFSPGVPPSLRREPSDGFPSLPRPPPAGHQGGAPCQNNLELPDCPALFAPFPTAASYGAESHLRAGPGGREAGRMSGCAYSAWHRRLPASWGGGGRRRPGGR